PVLREHSSSLQEMVVPSWSRDAADQTLAQFYRDDVGEVLVGLRRVVVLIDVIETKIALQYFPGALVHHLGGLCHHNRILLDVRILSDDSRWRQVVPFCFVRWEPVITNVFPDGLSILNRGSLNDFFIYASRAVPLLSVGATVVFVADEGSFSELVVDWVFFSIFLCRFVDLVE